MIPKIIHYCWFGGGEKPERVKECIASWKAYDKDLRIIEWNEDNFDFRKYNYTKIAYNQKCWSKVSNFVRMWALYNYGGIYLDTDVLVLKSIEPLFWNNCFFGLEYNKKWPFYSEDFRTTLFGTAIIGSEPNHQTIGRILEHYIEKKFTKFEKTEESNNVLLITNLFKDDIINNCTVYGSQILYPCVENELSYTKHLKFDSWRVNRI